MDLFFKSTINHPVKTPFSLSQKALGFAICEGELFFEPQLFEVLAALRMSWMAWRAECALRCGLNPWQMIWTKKNDHSECSSESEIIWIWVGWSWHSKIPDMSSQYQPDCWIYVVWWFEDFFIMVLNGFMNVNKISLENSIIFMLLNIIWVNNRIYSFPKALCPWPAAGSLSIPQSSLRWS